MKQRFSSLDIKVIAHELSQELQSLRLVNIYDLSSRIFLFKFAKPDHKQQFVVDAGFRCHLTSFARTTADAPSPFVSRLRKFLKTRRVTSARQVGTDRILEIQFSEGQYRLYLEFYAAGNIIFTDAEYKIIALYRNVNEGAEHERVCVGATYTLSQRQNVDGIPDLSAERVKEGMRTFIERQTASEEQQWKGKKAGKQKKGSDLLRKALSSTIHEYPPMLLQHALKVKEVNTSMLPEEVMKDESAIAQILDALKEAATIVEDISSREVAKGYIIAKRRAATAASEDGAKNDLLLYDDYQPFQPRHFAPDSGVEILEFDGFNNTVDEFYSSIEGQRLESRLQEKMDNAKKKLEHARDDQAKRIGGLQAVQELNVRKAQAIEANLERVEEAKAAINGLIAQGMDWVEIDQLIALEQKKSNPVAHMIKLPLKLNENTATLLLGELEEAEDDIEADATDSEPSDSSDDEDENLNPRKPKVIVADKRLAVDIDLSESGWSNARSYYDQKKTAASKQQKTAQASTKALKSAESKIQDDLKRALNKEKDVLRPVRVPMWFEKFLYFVSSEGYLVIGGKDAQQHEILFKRHLRRGDVFVHADLNGAASLIVKNDPGTPDAPIPPSTLSQAGHLSVCTSTAWDSKAVMSAWWVNAAQVKKLSSQGDLMATGTFYIQGEKNFLPPAQLLLGFAVIWRISEESKANHGKHRIVIDASSAPTTSKSVTTTEAESGQDDGTPEEELPQSRTSTDIAPKSAEKSNSNENGGGTDDRDEYDVEGEEEEEGEANDDEDDNEEDEKYITNPLQRPVAQANDETTDLHAISDSDADDNDDVDEAPDNEVFDNEDSKSNASKATPSNKKPKAAPQVRGKRGKRKKLATKYANQDEEDREIAMQLLGSRAGQEKAEAKAREARAAEEEAARMKQRRKEQAEKALARALQRNNINSINGEVDGDAEGGEDDAPPSVDLQTLVPAPQPNDRLLEAIPVCAPWSALARYKYKAKIQPGAQKKGKAVREILGKWAAAGTNPKFIDQHAQDTERIWPEEIQLIKAWKDVEVFGVLPVGKVRVMMGGGASGGGKGGKSGSGGGGGARGRKKK